MNKNKNLTDGSPFWTLIKFTVPILLSILLQITYGTVDLLIVGQFSDVANVSGVSIGSQVIQVITSFCVGLSLGTTVLLGRYIGAGEDEKSSKIVGASIFLFAILSVVLSILVVLLTSPIAVIMQTPSESFEYTKNYLFVSGIGTIFIVVYNLLGSIFRGIGDSKTPLLTVLFACIANIFLDLILVAGFGMGASGAAIATVLAQAISVVLSILIIKRKGLPFHFSKMDISFQLEYTKSILKIGVPSSVQMVLTGFSFLALTAILNTLGVVASAAVGIVGKITGMIMVVPQAFSQSLSAYTAQNLGAKLIDRTRKGLKYAIIVSFVFGAIMTYIAFMHGNVFTILFTDDPATTEQAVLYLKSYALDCSLVAFFFSFTGYFNGCGRTTFVMLLSIIGAFAIRIPISYLFSLLENTNLFIIGLAIPLSTALQIIVAVIYYIITKKKDELKQV